MDLSKATDEDIQNEIKRRKNAKRAAELERRQKVDAANYANIDHLIAITPHERTSCSDRDPCNGGTNSHGYPACARCFLLTQKFYGYWKDDDVELKITLEPRSSLE